MFSELLAANLAVAEVRSWLKVIKPFSSSLLEFTILCRASYDVVSLMFVAESSSLPQLVTNPTAIRAVQTNGNIFSYFVSP